MDLMLQTASDDNAADWKKFFRNQIRDMAERYHSLPDDFDAQIEGLLKKRDEAKSKMKPEELADEVFKAYLASVELTEEQWRNQRQTQAAKEVCLDLLLDAVAEKEKMTASADEIHEVIEDIAAQCNMDSAEAEANINKDMLIRKIRTDKALSFILNSGITDEADKAQLDKKRAEEKEKLIKEAKVKD